VLDKLEEMPKPKELALRGERWGPYRTLAGLYLWRIADSLAEAKADSAKPKAAKPKPKTRRSQD
jgi:DNA-3-methyladenine glycosylase II